MGARPTKDGVSGVHTHMTNSLNTPAEALEHAYPFVCGNILCAPKVEATVSTLEATASSAKSKS